MSCGHPHELDCSEALNHLYEYLDGEVGTEDHRQIAQHLVECAPCLKEFDIEQVIRRLVARSACEVAPAQLRVRISATFASLRVRPPSGDA